MGILGFEKCEHDQGYEGGPIIWHCLGCNEPRKTEIIKRSFANPYKMRRLETLQEIYDQVLDYKVENGGNSPSMRWLQEACYISSTDLVRRYLIDLQNLGLIERGEGARQIAVVGWGLYKDSLVSGAKA